MPWLSAWTSCICLVIGQLGRLLLDLESCASCYVRPLSLLPLGSITILMMQFVRLLLTVPMTIGSFPMAGRNAEPGLFSVVQSRFLSVSELLRVQGRIQVRVLHLSSGALELLPHAGFLVAHQGSLQQPSLPARRRPWAVLQELRNAAPCQRCGDAEGSGHAAARSAAARRPRGG